MSESKVAKLEAAGVIDSFQLTDEEKNVIEGLSDEEVDVLVRLRQKMGEAPKMSATPPKRATPAAMRMWKPKMSAASDAKETLAATLAGGRGEPVSSSGSARRSRSRMKRYAVSPMA